MLGKIEKISMEVHDDINEHRHGELVEFLNAHGFCAVFSRVICML